MSIYMLTPQTLVERIQELTPIRTSAIRLLTLLGDERVTMADLILLVSQDVALSANLLRIANSAYYRGNEPVSSLHKAVVRLGTQGVYRAALGLSLRGSLPEQIPGYGISVEAFTQHSVACAVLAESLARDLGMPDRDSIFTAGLLHDIGKLVVGQFLAEQRVQVDTCLSGEATSLEEIERTVLALDHCAVGEQIAQAWGLPSVVGLATRWHHEPSAAPTAEARRIGSLIHCADGLAHRMGFGTGLGGLLRRHDSGAELALGPDAIDHLVASSFNAIQELAGALNAANF